MCKFCDLELNKQYNSLNESNFRTWPEELIFLTLSEHIILHKKGTKLTEEHRLKCGNAWRGKKFTDEHKLKISESGKGKHKCWSGKKFTDEHKLKISLRIKEYWRKKHEIDLLNDKLV